MNCQQAKSLLDSYADGELEASAIVELEQHLQIGLAALHKLVRGRDGRGDDFAVAERF